MSFEVWENNQLSYELRASSIPALCDLFVVFNLKIRSISIFKKRLLNFCLKSFNESYNEQSCNHKNISRFHFISKILRIFLFQWIIKKFRSQPLKYFYFYIEHFPSWKCGLKIFYDFSSSWRVFFYSILRWLFFLTFHHLHIIKYLIYSNVRHENTFFALKHYFDFLIYINAVLMVVR